MIVNILYLPLFSQFPPHFPHHLTSTSITNSYLSLPSSLSPFLPISVPPSLFPPPLSPLISTSLSISLSLSLSLSFYLLSLFIIMYIYYLTVYMFCISCYGTNKLLLCDFCTFVQINSIQFNSLSHTHTHTGESLRLSYCLNITIVDHRSFTLKRHILLCDQRCDLDIYLCVY